MRSTGISRRLTRRTILAGAAALAVAGTCGKSDAAHRSSESLVLSCGARGHDDFMIVGLNRMGLIRFERPLPARGHGVAISPDRTRCAVFSRRPGAFVCVLDPMTGVVVRWIDAAPGRAFCGHGTFSTDGRLLFATENDFDAGRGVLGIYDAARDFARIDEIPCHGIGPHEVRLLPDGVTLVVANGGILTHPDHGRAKLNISTMAPNLAFLDAVNGARRGLVRLPDPLHKLSIRHVATDRRGTVAVAMQYEGGRDDRVPLVGICRHRADIHLLRAPDDIERRMRHYTGGLAFDVTETVLAVSSPRGHLVTFWDADTGAFLAHADAVDASGVAPSDVPGQFLVTGGDGAIRLIAGNTGNARRLSASDRRLQWDNHLG